jgi:hypothetical protein
MRTKGSPLSAQGACVMIGVDPVDPKTGGVGTVTLTASV